MKAKVQILRTDRQAYTRKSDGGAAIAHRITVITADGHAGDIFLGGDTERGRALYNAAAAIPQGGEAELVFGFSSFRGEVRTELVGINPVK